MDDHATGFSEKKQTVDHLLRQYSFYSEESAEIQTALRDAAVLVKPRNGQQLMEVGQPVREVLLVGGGSVRVYIVGPSGRGVTLYYVRRGDTCPVNLSATMLSHAAFANAVSGDDVVAAVIPSRKFRDVAARSKRLQDFLFTATVSRFGEMIALIREITTSRVDHRLANYLLNLFEESDEKAPVIETTQHAIALDLGTVREVVGRRLRELETLGAVRLARGRIILVDRAALHRVVS